MVNGAVDSGLRAGDFRFEQRDPRLQFVDRKRIEILFGQHNQRIAGILGQDVIQVHGRIVDQGPESVNEARMISLMPSCQRKLASISRPQGKIDGSGDAPQLSLG